ncbi:MAG: SLC13 family permease [Alphaproteobacteria bacterium]
MLRAFVRSLQSPGGAASLFVMVVAAALFFGPPFFGPGSDPESVRLYRVAASTLFCLALWAISVVPIYLTALVFLLLASLFKLGPLDVIFSGFASPALWLIFGGFILGVAVQETGLGARMAASLVPYLGRSYRRIVFGVVLVAMALGFAVPSSMARMVVLMPIVVALAETLGFGPGSKGRTGITLAAAFATFMPMAAVLPANVPNVVLAGIAETVHGVPISYVEYLALHFPVLGALKTLVIAVSVLVLFPDTPRIDPVRQPAAAMTPEQKRLAVILVAALGLWMTDFLHGISPAWVALAAGLMCFVPGVNVVPRDTIERRLNYGTFIYVAGLLGLGNLIAESGLGKAMGDALLGLAHLDPARPHWNFFALTAMGTLISWVATLPGEAAVLGPVAAEIAAATGLPLMTVLMIIVVGFSTVILPYQAGPMIVGIHLAGVTLTSGTRLCATIGIATIVVLLPLNFLWWRVTGWLP